MKASGLLTDHCPVSSSATDILIFVECNGCHIFRRECAIARFLCAMHVFMFGHHPHPFVSLATSVGELVHGEKSHNKSITHSPT